MGMDINYDGKVKYLESLAKKAETTNTVNVPVPTNSKLFE